MAKELSRRTFIQAVAFVGAAMTLPATLKAADLPKPESVIILPEDHPAVLPQESPLVWLNKMPLTGAHSFRFRYQVDLKMRLMPNVIPPFNGEKRGVIDIALPSEDFAPIYDMVNTGGPIDVAWSPGHKAREAYIAKVYNVNIGYENDWRDMPVMSLSLEVVFMTEVSPAELLKHVGASEKVRLIIPAAR